MRNLPKISRMWAHISFKSGLKGRGVINCASEGDDCDEVMHAR